MYTGEYTIMTTGTVRINQQALQTLRELAGQRGISMSSLLEEVIENQRRADLLAQANAAYSALQADSQARQELQEERDAWDVTLRDGLGEQ